MGAIGGGTAHRTLQFLGLALVAMFLALRLRIVFPRCIKENPSQPNTIAFRALIGPFHTQNGELILHVASSSFDPVCVVAARTMHHGRKSNDS